MAVYSKAINNKVNVFFICATVLCFPINKLLVSIGIIVLLINYLLDEELKSNCAKAVADRGIQLFIGLFVLHIVGLLWTDNMSYGLKDLQVKLTLLIAPLILFGRIDKHTLQQASKYFVIGCAAAGAYCLVVSGAIYLEYGDVSEMYYLKFSRLMHPGYFALYINFSIFILFHDLIQVKSKAYWPSWVSTVLIIFFSSCLFLLLSRNGLLTFGGLLILGGILLVLKKKWKSLRFLAILVMIGFALSYQFMSKAYERLAALSLEHHEVVEVNKHPSSWKIRTIIWREALALSVKHPMGVGTGDVVDVLSARYAELELDKAAEMGMNAHNQLLQISVTLGFVALLWFIISLSYPFVLAMRKKNITYLVFITIVFVYCLSESVLEVQAGTTFYGFFNALMYSSLMLKEENIT